MTDFISNLNFNFNSPISYFLSAELQSSALLFKIIFMAISAFLLGMIIFLMTKTHYWEWLYVQDIVQFVTKKPMGAKKITRQWSKITERLAAGTESEYKLALIEADDLLDASLKRMGYAGQTLEEKLSKLTAATLPNINQLYEVHRLRNNVVHDPDYRLALDEARKALDVYAKSFTDLQILLE